MAALDPRNNLIYDNRMKQGKYHPSLFMSKVLIDGNTKHVMITASLALSCSIWSNYAEVLNWPPGRLKNLARASPEEWKPIKISEEKGGNTPIVSEVCKIIPSV